MRAPLLLAVFVAITPLCALGQIAKPTDGDKVAQSRAVRISEELRCLVCQNQSIADSNAELAIDLRQMIREQIAEGKSDQEIRAYMVARYGDFVLYRPPLKATTLLLWVGPALLLVGGLLVLRRVIRARGAAAETTLTAEERTQAERMLAGETKGRP